jgi:formate dehydrogenase subunit delta
MPSSPPGPAASPPRSRQNNMQIERLRYMADQIARNFAAEGEARAAEATAEHIRLFWDPRMKAAILADDPAVLPPVVAAAVERLRG